MNYLLPSKALTVLAIDRVQGFLHLHDILWRAGIQGVLHHRLLGTARASEGVLQGDIGPQARIDLHQAMGTSQQTDEGIVEFVAWAILDRLLRNLDLLSDRAKQVQFSELDAKGRQTGTTANLLAGYARFVHDGEPPLVHFFFYKRYGSSSFFWQAPFCSLSATNWGQI